MGRTDHSTTASSKTRLFCSRIFIGKGFMRTTEEILLKILINNTKTFYIHQNLTTNWDKAMNIRGAFNKFPDFFVQVFRIVEDFLWDDWPILMISCSNEQLHQELEYTLLKPDCQSWWISKMQSGREDTLEERYAIKFCFKLGKIPEKHMECFRLLLDHLAWIEHQFLSSLTDSRKAGSLWEMIRGVEGVRKSEHQSWLAK